MSEVSESRNPTEWSGAILAQAIDYCAQKARLDTQVAIERLRAGDHEACGYCHYSVAKQVAECLAGLDTNVKAAYLYDWEATPEDKCFAQPGRALPIHLIVWTERKTAALRAAAETWDRALAQGYARVFGAPEPEFLLDVQVVDDGDVDNRVGYGALLSSLHHPALQVWAR